MKRWALLFALSALFFSTTARASDYVSEWPKERQHLLAGHYNGKLHAPESNCASMDADLILAFDPASQSGSGTYRLRSKCTDHPKGNIIHTTENQWWIDEIAGSCLILDQGNSQDPSAIRPLHGFRISDDAKTLSQDGSSCTSGGPAVYDDKILKRIK